MFSWVLDGLEKKVQLNDRVKVAFMDFSGAKLPVFELERETVLLLGYLSYEMLYEVRIQQQSSVVRT